MDVLKQALKWFDQQHADDMVVGANAMLEALISELGDGATKFENNIVTFDKQKVIDVMLKNTGSINISDANLRKRIQQLNSSFKGSGEKIELQSRKTSYLLKVDDSFLKLSDHLVAETAQAIADQIPSDKYVNPNAFPERAVFISHKWSEESETVNRIFREFAGYLKMMLLNPPENKPVYKVFFDADPEDGFEMHEDRNTQQDKYCEEAVVALVMWSDAYKGSPDCQRELSYFIDDNGQNKKNKRAIVLLENGLLKHIPPNLKSVLFI